LPSRVGGEGREGAGLRKKKDGGRWNKKFHSFTKVAKKGKVTLLIPRLIQKGAQKGGKRLPGGERPKFRGCRSAATDTVVAKRKDTNKR